jgi:hypothetical protein
MRRQVALKIIEPKQRVSLECLSPFSVLFAMLRQACNLIVSLTVMKFVIRNKNHSEWGARPATTAKTLFKNFSPEIIPPCSQKGV